MVAVAQAGVAAARAQRGEGRRVDLEAGREFVDVEVTPDQERGLIQRIVGGPAADDDRRDRVPGERGAVTRFRALTRALRREPARADGGDQLHASARQVEPGLAERAAG